MADTSNNENKPISSMEDLQILGKLTEDYKKGSLSALIGAGFSMNVSKEYKNWADLLYDAYLFVNKDTIKRSFVEYCQTNVSAPSHKVFDFEKFVKNKINEENLLEIVSKYIELKGYREAIDGYIEQRTPYAVKIGDKFYLKSRKKGSKDIELEEVNFSVHEQLLKCNKFVNLYTTNYDNLLEFTAKEIVKAGNAQDAFRSEAICNDADLSDHINKKNIIKIHGSLRTDDDMSFGFDNDRNLRYIISKEDYEQYMKKHEAFTYLMRIAMLSGRFCLIGFSGTDPNYTSWLEWMKDIVNKKGAQDIKVYRVETKKDYKKDVDEDELYCQNLYNDNHRVAILHIFDEAVLDELFTKSRKSTNDFEIKEVLERLLQYLADEAQKDEENQEDAKKQEVSALTEKSDYKKGFELYYGTDDVERNHDKAFKCLNSIDDADKSDDVKAILAECYLYGRGTQPDVKMAVKLSKDNGKVAADVLYIIGNRYFYGIQIEKDILKAVEWYKRAAEKNHADALFDLGILHQEGIEVKKDLMYSRDCYSRALELYGKLRDKNPDLYVVKISNTLNNLANVHSEMNDYDSAAKEHDEALKIRRDLAEKNPYVYLPGVAMTLNNLAILHYHNNDYDSAAKEYEESLKIYRDFAERNPDVYLPYVATALNNLAVLHYNSNDYDSAAKEYEESLKIYRDLAEKNPDAYLPDVANILGNFGELHVKTKDFDKALSELNEAYTIISNFAERNPNKYRSYVAEILKNFGNLYRDTGKYEEAENSYNDSISIYEEYRRNNKNIFTIEYKEVLEEKDKLMKLKDMK